MKKLLVFLLAMIMLFSASFAVATGDVTLDGKFDSRDIAAIQKYLLNIKDLNHEQLKAADFNSDGYVNSRDIARLQLSLINALPGTSNSPVPSAPSASSFSIHFIDVGQADAALIECDGHYMLIDGGNRGDSSLIYSVLEKEKVSVIDILVATHAHEDHIGGLSGALNYTSAKLTLCPVKSYNSEVFNNFKKYADENGGGITVPKAGDEYMLSSAKVKILGLNFDDDVNNTSIVLKITYGKTTFLFTGDAEREAEEILLDSGEDLSATVLKVGHHGGSTSTTYPFLREVMPEYAVISVGTGNSYDHPTDETLSKLKDAEVKLFRTDLQGDIYCTSDGNKVSFTVKKNKDADVFVGNNSSSNNSNSGNSNPDIYDYVLNTNTKKFHYPSCSSASRISSANKSYFKGTRQELINTGYNPCGNCKP